MITSKAWWEAAGIRALKTVCQTAIPLIPTTIVLGASIDWMNAGWIVATIAANAVLAGVLSLLTSLAGLPEVPAQMAKE